jgi:hypothetical protein
MLSIQHAIPQHVERAASRAFDGSLRYKLENPSVPINWYELVHNFSPLSATHGTKVDIRWKPDASKFPVRMYRELNLKMTVSNADATDIASIINPYYLFSEIRIGINGNTSLTQTLDRNMIQKKVSEFFVRRGMQSHQDLVSQVRWYSGNMSPDLTTSVPALGSATLEISLLPFLDIERISTAVSAHGIREVLFEVTFAPLTSVVSVDHQGVVNDSANAEIYSQLSYSNIQLRELTTDVTDAGILRLGRPPSTRLYSPQFDIITESNWTGAVEKVIKLDEFPSRRCIMGVYAWVIPGLTGYQDPNAGRLLSGPMNLGFKFGMIGSPETDIDLRTDIVKSRRWHWMAYRAMFGHNPREDLIFGNNADDDSTGVIMDDARDRFCGGALTFIPFQLISTAGLVTNEDDASPVVYGGVSTENTRVTKNWEMKFLKAAGRANFPAGSTLVLCAVSQEEIAVAVNGATSVLPVF